jgi:hypothetical protein
MSKLLTATGTAAVVVLLAIPAAATAKTVRCHVPNVKGDTLTVAKRKLSAAHCAAGRITGTRAGKVATQSPRAGRTLKRGTKVQIALKATSSTKTTTAPPTTIVAPTVSYSTKVDPTFVQSPTDPLAVTYSYSADAVQTQGALTKDLAQDDQLPAGILNLYSQGVLECSENVGGATSDGTCAVTYSATGTYAITTQYIPNGQTAVTETDPETILPFATTTAIAIDFGAPFNVTGPPPTDAQSVNWFDGLGVSSTDTANASFTVTVTDATTSQSWTSTANTGNNCALEFVNPAANPNIITVDPGCGLTGFSFSFNDTVNVAVTTSGSDGWTGSTSATDELWGS